LTFATGFTATAFTLAGLVTTCATAGFGFVALFTETACVCGTLFGAAPDAGFTKTPITGALLVTGAAFAPEFTGFIADACLEATFAFESALAGFAACETAFAFKAGTAGLVAACAEPALLVTDAPAGLLPATCTEAGFTNGAFFDAFTGTAFTFGATLVALAFTPFGEGLPTGAAWVTAGCTLTAAGAAGVCTAVGLCANAAADKSKSVPRVRII
jgi:hypothetical protein